MRETSVETITVHFADVIRAAAQMGEARALVVSARATLERSPDVTPQETLDRLAGYLRDAEEMLAASTETLRSAHRGAGRA